MATRLGSAARRVKNRILRRPPSGAPPARIGGPFAFGPEITYSPELDGGADPGEVVWTWVPYEDDPKQGKDRPVLLLGWDGPLLFGLALSSKDHSGRSDCMALGAGAWDREGRPSYVKLDRLISVDPSKVRREGAVLDRERFDEVVARVGKLHRWRPSEPDRGR